MGPPQRIPGKRAKIRGGECLSLVHAGWGWPVIVASGLPPRLYPPQSRGPSYPNTMHRIQLNAHRRKPRGGRRESTCVAGPSTPCQGGAWREGRSIASHSSLVPPSGHITGRPYRLLRGTGALAYSTLLPLGTSSPGHPVTPQAAGRHACPPETMGAAPQYIYPPRTA